MLQKPEASWAAFSILYPTYQELDAEELLFRNVRKTAMDTPGQRTHSVRQAEKKAARSRQKTELTGTFQACLNSSNGI